MSFFPHNSYIASSHSHAYSQQPAAAPTVAASSSISSSPLPYATTPVRQRATNNTVSFVIDSIQSPTGAATSSADTHFYTEADSQQKTHKHKTNRAGGWIRTHRQLMAVFTTITIIVLFCVIFNTQTITDLPNVFVSPISTTTVDPSIPPPPAVVSPMTTSLVVHRVLHNQHKSECSNSIQGRELLTDDTGAVCLRSDISTVTGCCDKAVDVLSCGTCRSDLHCCESYEYCVSCCMRQYHQNNSLTDDAVFPPSVFPSCLQTCRTSSRSIKHGNVYKHRYHYCYQQLEGQINISRTDISVIAATRGSSCEAACQQSADGLVCVDALLPTINTCDVLQQFFSCSLCEKNEGVDQPAYVVTDAPTDYPRGRCLINKADKAGNGMNCEGHHEYTQRLCPCVSQAVLEAGEEKRLH